MPISLVVDGRAAEVADDGATLLEALRDGLGLHSPKDGCSPQGQCGCCTVLIDGQPRVACVTPVRRVAGREVVTLAGLDRGEAGRWADAFARHGASQCGFCTPGIIVRLAGLDRRSPAPLSRQDVVGALIGHLCRCTGWQTIVEAALDVSRSDAPGAAAPPSGRAGAPAGSAGGLGTPAGVGTSGADPGQRDLGAAGRRAFIEGGTVQRVGPEVALGEGGFAEDTAPADSLVAVRRADGDWAVGETLRAARLAAGKVQGRHTSTQLSWPLEAPPGPWDLTLRTTWVEPAYLEPDAAWCEPGGEPAGPLANGGAFGAKLDSPVVAAARELATRHGRPVRVVLAREDVVRCGPKRPPVAAGVCRDGTGVFRAVRTSGLAEAVARVAPGLVVEEVEVPGPPTSVAIRAAGWAEAAVLLAALEADGRAPATVVSPAGSWARAEVGTDGSILVQVAAGPPLDAVVLRSYCIGAAHQALGWVTSEGIAVSPEGDPEDLTIRSFGVLRARETPAIVVELVPPGQPPPDRPGPAPDRPVNGSDAVFAAVAAAVWINRGLPPAWPLDHRRSA